MKTFRLRQNKKGVSPIIATLLLIVIAVAAAVVTYAFVTGFIGTATSQSTQQGAMVIDTGAVNTNLQLTVYVRNTGTKSEILGTSVYVNNTLVASETYNTAAPPFTLAPNGVVTVVITGVGTTWADGHAYTVKVVANDGTPVAYSLHA